MQRLPGPIKQIASIYSSQTRNKPFNIYEYYLRNARHFDPKPAVKRGEAKQCVTNSASNALRNDIDYIEGWMLLFGSVPILHAWNRVGTKAIDSTADTSGAEYWGIVIPNSLVGLAASHKGWTRSTGVMETMRFFSDEELIEASEILGERMNENLLKLGESILNVRP